MIGLDEVAVLASCLAPPLCALVHTALFGQNSGESVTPAVVSLLGNGGVGIALIFVVRLFLTQQQELAKLQAQNTDQAFQRFESKLDSIEERHARVEQQHHEQMQALVSRMLESSERLAQSLAELRGSIVQLAVSQRTQAAVLETLQTGRDDPRGFAAGAAAGQKSLPPSPPAP